MRLVKKNSIRITAFTMAFLFLCLGFYTKVSAAELDSESEDSDSVVIYEMSQAEIDAEMDRQMQYKLEQAIGAKALEQLNNPNMTRAHPLESQFKLEKGPIKYITLSGYAGNQLPGGYRFHNGGGFYFSDSGGPTVSASLSFSAKWGGSIGVSVRLGNSGGSGRYYNAPDTTSYWKLYVVKKVQVEPYILYEKKPSSTKWIVNSRGSNQVVINSDGMAKKVN